VTQHPEVAVSLDCGEDRWWESSFTKQLLEGNWLRFVVNTEAAMTGCV
jgi:hypothetical protein